MEEKMKGRFKPSLSSRATLKKLKHYEFPEISDTDKKLGIKATYDKPHYVKTQEGDYLLYNHAGHLYVKLFLGFQTFQEEKE